MVKPRPQVVSASYLKLRRCPRRSSVAANRLGIKENHTDISLPPELGRQAPVRGASVLQGVEIRERQKKMTIGDAKIVARRPVRKTGEPGWKLGRRLRRLDEGVLRPVVHRHRSL
jgi:hypothetical protein